MDKNKIIINSVENKYGNAPFNDYELTLLYMDVNFDYGQIYNAKIRIDTNELIDFDTIKDKIIEEINK